MATNTDKVVMYVLSNASKLQPEKIRALAEIVRALGGEVSKEPNTIPVRNDDTLTEDQPLDLGAVENIEIDGTKRPVKIY
jgi:hypothetical protein